MRVIFCGCCGLSIRRGYILADDGEIRDQKQEKNKKNKGVYDAASSSPISKTICGTEIVRLLFLHRYCIKVAYSMSQNQYIIPTSSVNL